MRPNFHLKFFVFYVATIAAVLILFKGVTAYGESQLKAPVSIGGDYSLKLDTPPNCLKNKDLTLKIEQSGLYIFAHLALEEPENNPIIIPLTGKFQEQKVIVSGILNPLFLCSSDVLQTSNQLTLTGEFKDKILIGQLQEQNLSKMINFTGKLNPVSKSEKQTH